MIAFVQGKRIVVDEQDSTVTVHGRIHVDHYPWSDAEGRVDLYRKLHAKHPVKQFYAASLAASERAAEMVASLQDPRT